MSRRQLGPKRGTAEWRARVAKGVRRSNDRRREAARVTRGDLDRFRKSGDVAPGLLPLLEAAEVEALEIANALGGEEGRLTPQRRALLQDFVSVGIALRGALATFLRTHDHEIGSKIASLASARRQTLQALGLERWERLLDPMKGVDVQWTPAPAEAVEDAIPSAGPPEGGSSAGTDESPSGSGGST